MKWLLYSLFYFCSIFSAAAQQDTINPTDTTNRTIPIEKEFQYNKFFFGPRIEILNPFKQLTYTVKEKGKDTTYTTDWQVRIRLAQIEYQATDRIRIGIAPFWMLGPVPRRGYYQTPTSLYATFWLDQPKTLQLECLFQTTSQAPVQLSVRKTL